MKSIKILSICLLLNYSCQCQIFLKQIGNISFCISAGYLFVPMVCNKSYQQNLYTSGAWFAFGTACLLVYKRECKYNNKLKWEYKNENITYNFGTKFLPKAKR
jgi:hypothetical protein